MIYQMTRKMVMDAFEDSLTKAQERVFDQIGQNQDEPYSNLIISPFTTFLGMGMHDAEKFDKHFLWIPIVIDHDQISFEIAAPHLKDAPTYLHKVFGDLSKRLHLIRDKMDRSTYSVEDAEFLNIVYKGEMEQYGWVYDWTDLVYFVDTITYYLELIVNSNNEEDD